MKRILTFTNTIKGAQSYDLMPHYSKIGIDYVYNYLFRNRPQVIADIGSGTGRLSAQLLNNNTIYGVEPDEKMRMIAKDKFNSISNFHSIIGTAENTTLQEESMDFLVVGQAFHRFNIKQFRMEANKILKDKDNVIILWNRVNYGLPIFKDLLIALKTSYSAYQSRFICSDEIEGSKLETDENNTSVQDFFSGHSKLLTFDNPFVITLDRFKQICLSLWIFPLSNGNESEAILKSKNFNLDLFLKLIKELYFTYQKDGMITLPLKTDIHFCP